MVRQRARNFVAGRESNMAAETTGTPRAHSLSLSLSLSSSHGVSCVIGAASGRLHDVAERERQKESERIGRLYFPEIMTISSGTIPQDIRFDHADFPAGARNARRRSPPTEIRGSSGPPQRRRSGGMATGSTRAALRRTSRDPPRLAAATTVIPTRRDNRTACGGWTGRTHLRSAVSGLGNRALDVFNGYRSLRSR